MLCWQASQMCLAHFIWTHTIGPLIVIFLQLEWITCYPPQISLKKNHTTHRLLRQAHE